VAGGVKEGFSEEVAFKTFGSRRNRASHTKGMTTKGTEMCLPGHVEGITSGWDLLAYSMNGNIKGHGLKTLCA
jgi:hypothetical protein